MENSNRRVRSASKLPTVDDHARPRLGVVGLRVADLTRSQAFYEGVLGLRATEDADASALLEAHDTARPLLRLHPDPEAMLKPRHTTGLYHVALLLPSRQALARTLVHLLDERWPMQGAANHAVSEALYLADPDGNGLEIYADRPRDTWQHRGGELFVTTEALDFNDLMTETPGPPQPWVGVPAGTVVGHLHLQVSDLKQGERFYRDVLGLDVTVRGYPGALFLSAGGYHHHVGLNVWSSRGAPRPPAHAAGLVDFEWLVDARTRDAIATRAREAGVLVTPLADGIGLEDGDGHIILVR